MKKDLYFVKTNGYNMVVSVDDDRICRYLTENDDCSFAFYAETDIDSVIRLLESVEDDSSWESDCTYEQIFDEFPDDFNVIAKISKDL